MSSRDTYKLTGVLPALEDEGKHSFLGDIISDLQSKGFRLQHSHEGCKVLVFGFPSAPMTVLLSVQLGKIDEIDEIYFEVSGTEKIREHVIQRANSLKAYAQGGELVY